MELSLLTDSAVIVMGSSGWSDPWPSREYPLPPPDPWRQAWLQALLIEPQEVMPFFVEFYSGEVRPFFALWCPRDWQPLLREADKVRGHTP